MGTLKELISALEHFPQDKPVVIRHNGEDHEHEAALIFDDGKTVVMEICEGKLSPADMRLFAFDDDPESEYYNMFLVVRQDFWEEHGHLDDQHIGGMPSGFDEVMESIFEYAGTAKEGRELLLKLGYKEEKKISVW